MENLGHILNGFTIAVQPLNLLFLFFGAVLGTVIGLLQGISLLLPVTFGMDPIPALIMLAGIYYGAMNGNTVSAVLINTPGTASAAMTSVDGYPMARNGRAGVALAIAAIASFIAGTLGIIALSLFAIPLAKFALRFSPAEYFTLMFFALTAVGSLTGRSMAKGIMSAVLGLMIATIGIDLQTGQPRVTMRIVEFQDGVPLLVVIVGMFAVAEVLLNVEKLFRGELKPIRIKGNLWLTREEWRRSIKPILRGGTIGFLVGVIPGGGGTIATILAYAAEKKMSKTPHRFGKGAVEGVAAPEAANNAATCGAFVPMLTMGVPGSGTTAVLLAAFIMYGIEPGPLLFQERPDLVWGLIDSMYLGNTILLVLNLPLVPVSSRASSTSPPGVLLTLILGIAIIGVYTINNSVLDLYVLLFFGALGYGFRKLDVPVAPLILALVLGGSMEQSFRQAMTISEANPIIFVLSTISVALVLLSLLSLLSPLFTPRLRRMAPVVEEDES